jgi:hypothetical protein
MMPSPSRDADLARLLLRVSVGGTMIAHGQIRRAVTARQVLGGRR